MASISWNKVTEYITESWHGYIIEFLNCCKEKRNVQEPYQIKVIENIDTIPLLRKNDPFIMEAFVNSDIDKKGSLYS